MPTRHPRRAFQDILDNVAAIRSHTSNLNEAGFKASNLVIDAVERCLSRISEAAVRLDDIAATAAPGPRWDQIRGLGNHLRHAYDTISIPTIWGIVTDDLDQLETACLQALNTLPPDP